MSNDFKELCKGIAAFALPVSFIFPPAAAVTVPFTVAGAVVGAASYGIGHATENEKLKEFGKDAIEVAGGAVLNDPTGKTGDFVDRATGTKK